jgi:hypothetical protein
VKFVNETLKGVCYAALATVVVFAVLLMLALRIEPKELELQVPEIRTGMIVYVNGGRMSDTITINSRSVSCSASAFSRFDDCDFLYAHKGRKVMARILLVKTFLGGEVSVPVSLKLVDDSFTSEWTQSTALIKKRWWRNTLIHCFYVAIVSVAFLYFPVSSLFKRKI